MEYDNTNQGLIGKNRFKTEDTHSDINGEINIEGVEYWLDGYHRERNDGTGAFYALRAKRKDLAFAQPRPQYPEQRQAPRQMPQREAPQREAPQRPAPQRAVQREQEPIKPRQLAPRHEESDDDIPF